MAKAQDWLTHDALTLLQGWARDGCSGAEIAQRMGISPATLKGWRTKHPQLNSVLSTDPNVTDFQVENALLQKALGYESVEKKVEISAKGERKEVETTKQVAPDMSAIALWLKKRRPEKWGDYIRDAPKPENNLAQVLEEGGIQPSEIPELQPPSTSDADLVETDRIL